MNKKDFLKAVRQRTGKFRADNIVIVTESGELHGKGVVEIVDGEFKIQVTLAESNRSPELPEGIKSKKDSWIIRGVIEDAIDFSVLDLPSNSSRNFNFGRPDRSILEFSTNRMELVPSGLDCLTSQQIQEMQQQASQAAGIVTPGISTAAASEDATPTIVRVTFHAVLPDFKLVERNGGTETKSKNVFLGESTRSASDTFHGEMFGWEYGLVERDGDLHVHFLSMPEHQSLGVDHDWQLFHAFLQAIAFTHAQHAWPFSVEHRRDGKLLLERIQLNDDVADSPHAPFTEKLAFNNLTKKLTWKFENVLGDAYAFFSADSKLGRESENLLHILREATNRGIPQGIRLLSLCSLLESLVRVIYEEKIKPGTAMEVVEFQKVKAALCEELKAKTEPAYQRLVAILSPAEPVNIRMQFDAVVANLGLKPSEKWQELYSQWRKARNPMSHRMSKENNTEGAFADDMIAESRIAGAINCMVLRLMNYSGYVRHSAYEDKYCQI